MGRAVRSVLAQYATFSGRASRSEYWWWVLFLVLVLLATQFVDYIVLMPLLGATAEQRHDGQPLSTLVAIATLLPSLAVGARRLHDTGRSGWWLLIGLVPIVGTLALLFFFIQPGSSDAA